jgi:hypothetical protein
MRKLIIGLGGKEDGVPRETSFDIAVASEVMAVLGLATSVTDLRERLVRIDRHLSEYLLLQTLWALTLSGRLPRRYPTIEDAWSELGRAVDAVVQASNIGLAEILVFEPASLCAGVTCTASDARRKCTKPRLRCAR